ncbi:hypothetical protein B296_00030016 [Ensete ventricosum]|uniref:Uncharacterized protein n=1 Tax=Ensete ventricosum TaxID=4639 RepID=A0A426YQS7_ENSVE|nr:hypothetical protein B296_00030016 [Ensete ventricosum]
MPMPSASVLPSGLSPRSFSASTPRSGTSLCSRSCLSTPASSSLSSSVWRSDTSSLGATARTTSRWRIPVPGLDWTFLFWVLA